MHFFFSSVVSSSTKSRLFAAKIERGEIVIRLLPIGDVNAPASSRNREYPRHDAIRALHNTAAHHYHRCRASDMTFLGIRCFFSDLTRKNAEITTPSEENNTLTCFARDHGRLHPVAQIGYLCVYRRIYLHISKRIDAEGIAAE